mmetsp:Transcript_26503/g.69694  ORF Transcript_26503/g.69694 Transcript_26503/m.69694 type:complete len:517 (-) Transcript_26503:627-2177(-)
MTIFQYTPRAGDVYASNKQEAIFCIFLFLTAATIFAMLVAQINEIVASLQESSKELDDYLDAYLSISPRLDTADLVSLRSFERYSFREDQNIRKSKEILSRRSLPEHLRILVAKRLENNMFSKVLFLSDMESISNIRSLFSGQMLIKSTTHYYSAKAIIADCFDKANGLMVVRSGEVRLELPLDSDEADDERRKGRSTTLLVLSRGDSFGDTSILGDSHWAGKYGVNADFVAHTHCAVTFVSKQDIEEIASKFEFFPLKCRIQRARERKKRFDEDLKCRFWDIGIGGIDMQTTKKLKTKNVFFWTLIARRTWDHQIQVEESSRAKQKSSETRCSRSENGSAELDPEQEQQIREAFELFDIDGNGTMSMKELAAAMMALGFQTPKDSKEWTDYLTNLVDSDGSGSLSLDEFRNLMTGEMLQHSSSTMDQLSSIYDELNAWPASRGPSHGGPSRSRAAARSPVSHGITHEKLQSACEALGLSLTFDEVLDMIQEADRDNDGSVSKEEFIHILKMSWYF